MKTITRKSLLYKTDVEYGDYAINYVLSCSHGCKYPCYAYQMAKRFGKVKDFDDWCEPKLVSNALELLDSEIPKLKDKIKSVHLCFTTDPFMYGYKEIHDMTAEILKRLHENNIPVTTLTKGIYPYGQFQLSKLGMYGISLSSLDENFREKWEPYTARYRDRIDHLKAIHDLGYKTWVSIEPYPPMDMRGSTTFVSLLNSVSFVDKIVFGKWKYNKDVKYRMYDLEVSVSLVKAFCSEYDIELHIKEGT